MKKFLACAALVVMACGKRGDPHPPVPVIPAATSDLVVTQRADRVLLSWSYPAMTTAGRSLTDIRRITIHRYVEELPVAPGGRDPKTLTPGDVDTTEPQPIVMFSRIPTLPLAQFEKLSTRLDSIEKANLATATAGARLLYTDRPPFRSTDGRPVRIYYSVVTEGGTGQSEYSNMATLVALPVGVAPTNVAASAKAENVTVTWKAPERAVTGESGPVVTGYNIYRAAPGTELGDLATPINSAPIKGTTYNDTPPYGPHEYRVAAVATTGPPSVQSDLSAPARVDFRDLVAPPAPQNVTTLVETKVVRLVWDPVDAPDLAGYNVYRNEAQWRLKLTPNLLKEPNFLDIAINIGIPYTYEVTAVDTSGNESSSKKTPSVTVPKTP